MQRLYSMFPQGLPGLGLVLLRAVIVLYLAQGLGGASSVARIVMFVTVMLVLCAGFLTSMGCVLLLLSLAFEGFVAGALSLGLAVQGLLAIALILLGPGAYSVDARIFGRRMVEVPKS